MPCPAPMDLQSYVDGELDPGYVSQVANHLTHCRVCHGMARDLATTATLLHTLADVPSAPSRSCASGVEKTMPVRKRSYLRWMILPAAACLAVAVFTAWRHFSPVERESTYVSAFVEAHRTSPPGEDFPGPCDFGLGGTWE